MSEATSKKGFEPGPLKVFLPERSLQGSEVPTYITWPKDHEVIHIRVISSIVIDVVEVHNASVESGVFHNFQTPGYLGFIVRVPKFKEPSVPVEITYHIEYRGGKVHDERHVITLFRPQLELVSAPPAIRLKKQADGIIRPTETIRLRNAGEGTAVIQFLTGASDGVLLQPSTALIEFGKGVKRDIEEGVPSVCQMFPEHRETILKLPKVFFPEEPIPLDRRLREMDDYFIEMFEAARKVPELDAELGQLIRSAIFKNLQEFNLINQFVELMQSIGNEKVLILNPLDTLVIKRRGGQIKLRIENTDLQKNVYPPLEITFEMDSDEGIEVPIHHIVRFVRGEMSGSS